MYRCWTSNFWARLALVFYMILITRLFFIQVIEKKKYQNFADRQSSSKINLSPERGSIYDRNFNHLAFEVDKYSFGINPENLKNKRKAAETLAAVTGNSVNYYLNLLVKNKFVWLARGVEQSTSKLIKFDKSNPVDKIKEKGRHYPFQKTAAHVLGSINIDNVGLSGIEKHYNHLLEGSPGFKWYKIDAWRKQVPGLGEPEKPPVNGKSIVLTLNIEYQTIAEEELKKGIERYGAKSGMVVMLDPFTGEVLALSSYPTFNPNNFSSYSKSDRRNRAIVDPFEPGSTFKIVATAAAIQEGFYKPGDLIFCENGRKKFPGGSISDHKPYAWLSFKQVFANSSNIGYAKLAQKLDKKIIYKYGRAFGFGTPSGIDLTGENRGKFTNSVRWSKSVAVRIPIGYGVMTTGIQLANAYAVIANGGYLLKPKILKAVLAGNFDNLINETKPDTIRKVLTPETVAILKSFMHEAVKSGTGKSAAIEGIEIAGKTGTTQKYDPVLKRYSDQKYIASFVGITPIKRPEIVCLVVVDEPNIKYKYGAKSAAPIFRNIIKRVHGSISEPNENNTFAITKQNLKKNRVPDITKVNIYQAKSILEALKFQVRTEGNGGYVKSQLPAPGMLLESGEFVKLTLGNKIQKDNQSNRVPNVVGKSIRDAIEILTQAGFNPVLKGSGYVVKQQPKPNTKSENRQCQIFCQPVSAP